MVEHLKPCNSELCLNILEGIKRRYTVQRKSLITVKHLYKIYSHSEGKGMSFANLRTMLICVFSFMGFLRFSEVNCIRKTGVVIKNTHIAIFIEKSKTDVYREGSWVHLTKLSSVLCPICLFTRHYRLANIKKDCTKYIFRAIETTRNISFLRNCDKNIIYTRVREKILQGLLNMGIKHKRFGLYSLRSAGATAAVNSGVKDRPSRNIGSGNQRG